MRATRIKLLTQRSDLSLDLSFWGRALYVRNTDANATANARHSAGGDFDILEDKEGGGWLLELRSQVRGASRVKWLRPGTGVTADELVAP